MLLALIPIHAPTFAVFVDEQGKPEFRAVVSIGLMEIGDKKRLAAGFTIGDHIEPADFKPNFVGFASRENPDEWSARCAEKLAAMQEKAAQAAKSKIYVPADKGLALHA